MKLISTILFVCTLTVLYAQEKVKSKEGEFEWSYNGQLYWYSGEFIVDKDNDKAKTPHGNGKLYLPTKEEIELRENSLKSQAKNRLAQEVNALKKEVGVAEKKPEVKVFGPEKYFYEGQWEKGLKHGQGIEITGSYEYTGQFVDGKREGDGEIKFPYGDSYKGQWKSDMKEGQGVYSWKDGSSYSGGWIQGKRSGYGIYSAKNGDRYKGEWKDDKMAGAGNYLFADGRFFSGEIRNDLWTGTAKMNYNSVFLLNTDEVNSSVDGLYEGEIANGKPNGNGRFISKIRVSFEEYNEQNEQMKSVQKPLYDFEGEWKEGKKNGAGKLVYATVYKEDNKLVAYGECNYNGSFLADAFSGQGVLIEVGLGDAETSSNYTGGFSNGKYHGEGSLEVSFDGGAGTISYKGGFENGEYHGNGHLIREHFCKMEYTGSFAKGMRHGKGLIKYSDVECSQEDWERADVVAYDGDWKEDKPNGTGTLTLKSGKLETGVFRGGSAVIPFNPKQVKIGNQTWMAENLTITKFRNGDPIPEAKTVQEWENAAANRQPAFCYYNNDPNTAKTHGVLYNWYAISDKRGLVPEGWTIPSSDDVETLKNNIETEIRKIENQINEKKSYGLSYSELEKQLSNLKKDYSTAWGGTKLKAKSGWLGSASNPNLVNGTDLFGFSAKPSACRENGYFNDMKYDNFKVWTKTTHLINNVYHMALFEIYRSGIISTKTTEYNVDAFRSNFGDGYPVRCIKVIQ